jgi:uncharacterized membrane protein
MPSPNFVTTYFTEEKIESLFFIIIGIIAVFLALIFLFLIKYSFYKGLAFPLLLIGLIQLIVGTTVYFRSPKDIIKVEQIIKNEPQRIQTEELPRMETVMQNFSIYKIIELLLILTGCILFVFFHNSPQTFWKGLGLGLIMQACIMLTLDIAAEKRGKNYIQHLSNLK